MGVAISFGNEHKISAGITQLYTPFTKNYAIILTKKPLFFPNPLPYSYLHWMYTLCLEANKILQVSASWTNKVSGIQKTLNLNSTALCTWICK